MRFLSNPRVVFAATLALIAAAGLVAVALADPGATEDDVFEVRMLDGAVDLEAGSAAAGREVIEVTNTGSTEHEVVILRTEKAADELALGLHGVSIKYSGELVVGEDHIALGHKHRQGEVLGLRPGEPQRYQVELERGHYVVYCQTASHYLAGERAEFTVR